MLAAVARHAPDVVLMDIRMPESTASPRPRRCAPALTPEIIVQTTFDADQYVLRALRAGAGGLLLKDTPPAEILRAIARVAAGEPILSPSVTRRLIARLGDSGTNGRHGHARALLVHDAEAE